MSSRRPILWKISLLGALTYACSGTAASNSVGSVGGDTSNGGATNPGGTDAAGAANDSGGASAASSETGGVPSTTGGAAAATGGKASGGSRATGGSRAFGGAKSTGGSAPTGGSGITSGDTGGTSGACVPNYSCTPTAPNTGDIYADCAARVNQFRACVCLPPLTRNTAAEACADQQAAYDAAQATAHAGFSSKVCTPGGNAQNECPGWGGWKSTTQVINQCILSMFNEGPPPTTPCSGTCYSTYGHYINMTGSYTKVACGFYTGTSGQVTSVQNFFP